MTNCKNIKCLFFSMVFVATLVVSTILFTNVYFYTFTQKYNTKIVTREDKISFILDKYELKEEEFKTLSAIVLTEAEHNSYADAYAVINTIYNRTQSKSFVATIDNIYGENTGNSLYYQAIAPNQFVVYQKGYYKRNLDNTNCVGYDAIIDFLYTEKTMHNYLSFRANYIHINNSESFSENGNNYFNELLEENRV